MRSESTIKLTFEVLQHDRNNPSTTTSEHALSGGPIRNLAIRGRAPAGVVPGTVATENGPKSAAALPLSPVTTGRAGAEPSAQPGTFSAMTALATPQTSIADTIDAFTARPELAPLTARTYRRALERLAAELAQRAPADEAPAHGPGCKPLAMSSSRFAGDPRYLCAPNCPRRRWLARHDNPAADRWPSARELEAAAAALWAALAPASWNRNVAALRSFLQWAHRHRYLDEELELRLDRRRARRSDPRDPVLAARAALAARERAAAREGALAAPV